MQNAKFQSQGSYGWSAFFLVFFFGIFLVSLFTPYFTYISCISVKLNTAAQMITVISGSTVMSAPGKASHVT